MNEGRTPKTTKVVWFSGPNCVSRETRMATGSDFMAYVRRQGGRRFMVHCPRTGERAWQDLATGTWHMGTPEGSLRTEALRVCDSDMRAGKPSPCIASWEDVRASRASMKDEFLRTAVRRLERGESLESVGRSVAEGTPWPVAA
jgi:hypothetical protein